MYPTKKCFTYHSNRLHQMGILVFLLLSSFEIAAQKASQAPLKSCLWKIASKDSTVYLLGSVHLLKSDAYPLSQFIEQAFSESTKLVLEVNLESLDSTAAQQLILAKSLLPEGKTLDLTVSPSTYQAVQSKVK